MPFDLQRKPHPGPSRPAAHRRPPSMEAPQGEASRALAYRSVPSSSSSAAEGGVSALSVGEPLERGVRGEMEARFGHDFSSVRVHHDERAAASADALSALAYTRGSDVVFSRGAYAPASDGGRRLLAHELAHVVQQRGAGSVSAGVGPAGGALEAEADEAAWRATSPEVEGARVRVAGASPFSVQRAPVTGKRDSFSKYEVGDAGGVPRQAKSTGTFAGAELPLAYDDSTGEFTVTFPLIWLFSHSWDDAKRKTYTEEFEASVIRVWNDRFELTNPKAKKPARVKIKFDHDIIKQGKSAADEQIELLMPRARGRWKMDVRVLNVRENVNTATGFVELGEASNKQHTRKAADLRKAASFSLSGTGGNKSFTQATSPHEFGHMIGLGDEYLEDSGSVPMSAVRGQINDRIMNVGENVTADAYLPFAEWLSGLTGATWSVGKKV